MQKFIKSENFKIIFSILVGFALASLFQRTCSGRSCIVYKSPNYKDINGQTFMQNGRCFVYSTEQTNCGK